MIIIIIKLLCAIKKRTITGDNDRNYREANNRVEQIMYFRAQS